MAGRVAALLLAWLAAGPALAGSFSVSPIRLELSPRRPAAILTVRNEEDGALVVQALPYAWSQPRGEDQLEETRRLIVTPAIFTLAPHGEQILRIAAPGGADGSQELPFRIVLSEIPGPAPLGFSGLRVALRISLPAFVKPQAPAAAQLAWSYALRADGMLEVRARNSGTGHVQVEGFEIASADRALLLHTGAARYVLPGAAATWEIPGAPHLLPQPRLLIRGRSDAGDFSSTGLPGPET
ncbi:MAG TPA: fimbria/pilus periplasmic chaperone [Steroidobacteraceae bacterium]|nr:fimbria/pilus periplasmic chaperone [Steroidobacteraceae bacterium]